MNAVKILLVLSVMVCAVLAWMWWQERPQMHASREDQAGEQSGMRVVVVDSSEADSALSNARSSEKSALPAQPVQIGQFKGKVHFDASAEFNLSPPKRQADWQAPPRLNLRPGRSTPFSKPDWDGAPPLNHRIDP